MNTDNNNEKEIIEQLDETLQESNEATEEAQVDNTPTLQEEYDKLHDSHLRLMAEYDNFRKRTLKEKADLIKSGGERILTSMLEVLDDMDRARESMETSTDPNAIKEGVELIYNKLVRTLESNGVEEIETAGIPFDADIFDAVAMVPATDDNGKNTIVECVKKGYKLHDKVLRHPKVVVAQ